MSNWPLFSWIEDFSWIFTLRNLVAFLEIKLMKWAPYEWAPCCFSPSCLSKQNFKNHGFLSLVVVPVAGFCSWVSALTSYISACLSNWGPVVFSMTPLLKDLIRVVDFQHAQLFSFCEDGAMTSKILIWCTEVVNSQSEMCWVARIKGYTSLYFPSLFFSPLLFGGPSSSAQKEEWLFY